MAHMLASIEMIKERLRSISPKDFFNARMLGFSLSRAWVYLMFFSSAVTFSNQSEKSSDASVYVVSLISLAATLIICAILNKRFMSLMEYPVARASGPVFMTIGTLLIATAGFDANLARWLALPGAVLTGIGSGFINLGWGEAYREIDPLKTSLEAPFAFFMAALFFPVVTSMSQPAASLLCAFLPLVSGWILFHHLRIWSQPPLVSPISIRIGRFAWKLGLSTCLFGLADGVMRSVFLGINPIAIEDFYRYPLLWASILSMLIIVAATILTRRLDYGFMYRPIILMMAFFFLLLPVLDRNTFAANVIALAGYGTFNLLIWIILAEAARNFRLSSVIVFGMGWGMITLGVFLGTTVGSIVTSLGTLSSQQVSMIALLATVTILISYLFVLNEHDIIELTSETEDDPKSEERYRPFQERCKHLAHEYELSAKETQIMILFAKGRSTPRIQEELFISRGTVTTHLRHIYQKLNIHDKQQLLDLIEGKEPN